MCVIIYLALYLKILAYFYTFDRSPRLVRFHLVKFMFSKKTTKINEIFTFDLTLCSKSQIYGEDLVNFCGLLRKHKLYNPRYSTIKIVIHRTNSLVQYGFMPSFFSKNSLSKNWFYVFSTTPCLLWFWNCTIPWKHKICIVKIVELGLGRSAMRVFLHQ